jgi:MoaA/NifB/PqqE/SkfB family radical SAM enzyme
MFEPDLASLIHSGESERTAAAAAGDHARQLNGILTAIDLACLTEEVLGVPEQHYLSTSDRCNIECHYCARQSYYGDRWDNGFMPIEAFRERLVPLARSAKLMGLYGLGEPFLHRDFFEFVRESRAVGARALTNCHGMSLKPKINEQIIESGLDVLNVSMDGAREETFNRLRHGAKFDVVVKQVRDLMERRDAAGSETPHLYLASMINRENIDELTDLVSLGHDLGAEQVDFSDTVICNPEDLETSVSGLPEMWEAIDRAKAMGERLGLRVNYSLQKPFPWRPFTPEELRPEPQVCDLAWGTWLVSKGGEVKPCCFIEWEFGNAFTDDPERIANGPEARELRRRLMSGDLPRECRGCGCAQPLTEAHQRAKLDEAERLLAESDLSEERRRELTGIITERRAMIEERWGARATV